MINFPKHQDYFLWLVCLVLLHCKGFSQEYKVGNLQEFNEAIAKVRPGDQIVLKNGEWRDVSLAIKGTGTEKDSIFIKAETPGQVIITGNSDLTLSGKYLKIEGLWFKDGFTDKKSVISFKKSDKEFATHSRITNCAITFFNPDTKVKRYHWIDLWGKNNRVDHNFLKGKNNEGPVLVVWLKGEDHIENNHRIDHNHFAGRPPLGYNGGETIRIGTSHTSMSSSFTVVENNNFQDCNGEVEIISNKTCDNTFRNNLFYESKGILTLRHGNRAIVEGNVFLGNGLPHTGGIRVINAGHIVRNNVMIGLTGTGFRGPIVVMNGVPNSPQNRYHQVKDADIQNNTVVNCSPVQFGTGSDEERSLPPANTVFANNLIFNESDDAVYEAHDDVSGINFENNIYDASSAIAQKGFEKASITWNKSSKLPVPSGSEKLISNFTNKNTPKVDITDTQKDENFIGALIPGNTKLPEALTMKYGTIDWTPKIDLSKQTAVADTIRIAPEEKSLEKAIKKANNNSVIILSEGTYELSKGIKIKNSVTIEGEDENAKPTIQLTANNPNESNYLFRIEEDVKLKLKNLIFSGKSGNPKYAIVSPDKGAPVSYSLFTDSVVFKDFKNANGGSIFKAYKGTFADTLSFVSSRFENSYRGINLSEEKEDKGKYSAQAVIIDKSIFKDIDQWALNYYRGGTDESTIGGQLAIDHSIFSNVNNREKGKIIQNQGIVFIDITNSVFERSINSKKSLELKGPKNKISNSLFFNVGDLSLKNDAVSENILYKNPKWENKEDFKPKDNSPLVKDEEGIRLKN